MLLFLFLFFFYFPTKWLTFHSLFLSFHRGSLTCWSRRRGGVRRTRCPRWRTSRRRRRRGRTWWRRCTARARASNRAPSTTRPSQSLTSSTPSTTTISDGSSSINQSMNSLVVAIEFSESKILVEKLCWNARKLFTVKIVYCWSIFNILFCILWIANF